MSSKFCEAVSWAFHSEPEDTIRNDLKYSGDMQDIYSIVRLLNQLGADYDKVYEWAKQESNK